MYSREADVYTLVSVEQSSHIENESLTDYEKRMVFICKDMCTEMKASLYFKEISHKVKGIDVVLSSPWCTYEVVHIEKDLEKKTKITDAVVASLFVKKDQKELRIVESYTSHILLNGYGVSSISGQFAQHVHFEYVHVYAQESFVSPLIKSLETIFHTHTINLVSIYGLIEFISQKRKETRKSELKIIVEEESIDVSYISEGSHITSMFIPYSQSDMEHAIAMKLSSDIDVTRQILRSRSLCTQEGVAVSVNKNAKRVWPDLDPSVQKIVEETLSTHLEKIVQNIRDCSDSIENEFLKTASLLTIYGVNPYIAEVYGNELAKKIAADPYITMKMPLYTEKDSVVSIF